MKGASSSGQSPAASLPEPSGDDRKRRRMQSNRESARRSRLRKQKHLDDLTAQIARISAENDQILSRVTATAEQYVRVEAQNSVLRAQMAELSQRLQSLNEISSRSAAVAAVGGGGAGSCMFGVDEFQLGDGLMNGSWNQQPIMAAAEMFDYY